MNKVMNILRGNVHSTVWRYYAFTFLKDMTFFSAVMVPFFTEWGGISLTQTQILQSWFFKTALEKI